MVLEKKIEDILDVTKIPHYSIEVKKKTTIINENAIISIVSNNILEVNFFLFFILILISQPSNNYLIYLSAFFIYFLSYCAIKSKNINLELISSTVLFLFIYVIHEKFNFIQSDLFYKYLMISLILFIVILIWYRSSIVLENIRYFTHAKTILLLIFLICSNSLGNNSPLIESDFFTVLLLQMIIFIIIFEYHFNKNWENLDGLKNLFHFFSYYSIAILILSSVINYNMNNDFSTSIVIILLSLFGIFILFQSPELFKEFLKIKDAKNIELLFLLYLGIICIHVLIYDLYSSDILFILKDQKTLPEIKENVVDYWINILYFSFASSNSIGYGELHPTSWQIKLVIIEQLLFSFVLLGVFISKLTMYYIEKTEKN